MTTKDNTTKIKKAIEKLAALEGIEFEVVLARRPRVRRIEGFRSEQAVLPRQSLLAIFQFPFPRARDRFDMCHQHIKRSPDSTAEMYRPHLKHIGWRIPASKRVQSAGHRTRFVS
jgi:hypothetical protein